jgi:PAS domain S-box-containing protein
MSPVGEPMDAAPGGPAAGRAWQRDLVGLSQAVLAITAEPDLDQVLQRIVDEARALVGARYGALGIPAPGGERLERLLVSGLDEADRAAIGSRPEGRGLLGVVLREGRAVRVRRIGEDPRSVGFPAHHPPMDSLLGVPIRRGEEILGDLYLTEKLGAPEFSEDDQALLELLAEHAALAIVNARLQGRLRFSEERYRALTESAPEIVFALDEAGHITFVNDRLRSVIGLAAGALLGLGLRQVVVAEDRAMVDAQLDRLRSGAARASFPIRALDPAGTVRHFDLSLVPRAGAEEGFLGIAQDVTERHAMAREIAERSRELAHTREAHEALRSFVAVIIQAQEEERARIAGDLHDTTVQTLTAIARRLQALATGSPAADSALAAELDRLGAAAQAEADEVRRLSRNLRPSVLDHLGLAAGLEQLAEDLRRQGLDVQLVVTGDAARLSDHVRTALFRIAQEALTNVRRHSRARHVKISLDVGAGEATLSVADDGAGFDAVALPDRPGTTTGLGLVGMRERAGLLGGWLRVESRPGAGTVVSAGLPVSAY